MKKDMPLEGLRWSRDSGSALYDTPQNGRSRTGWGGEWTAYAISRDGYNYQDINGGNPIFNPEEHARIKGGTRDAYITCMHNGKGYIMVTTDMCVRKSHKWTTMVSIS